jgi:hypothetical protein
MLTADEIVTALQYGKPAKVGSLVMAWDGNGNCFVKGRLIKYTRIETVDIIKHIYTVETDYEGQPTYDYDNAVGM